MLGSLCSLVGSLRSPISFNPIPLKRRVFPARRYLYQYHNYLSAYIIWHLLWHTKSMQSYVIKYVVKLHDWYFFPPLHLDAVLFFNFLTSLISEILKVPDTRCNVACNSCRSRIEFYFCDVVRNKLHRVTPSKNRVARNFARKVAACVRASRIS